MTECMISMIAAVAANGVIGADNDMPWRLSTDLKRFKTVTMGKPIIMGRKTFDSVGKALPGRLNIIITRDATLKREGAVITTSLKQAVELAREDALKSGENEVMVTGGGQIYLEAMAHAQKLYITHVDASPDGDTMFPDISEEEWRIVSEELFPAGEKDSADTRYCIYERI